MRNFDSNLWKFFCCQLFANW